MEAFASIKTVASITAICFLVGLFCKNRKWDAWIPCIVGTAGGLLGVVGLFVIPGFPAGNVLDAIAVGIASGLAATGAHQIYKQLFDNKPDQIPETVPTDASLTWEQFKADQGRITVIANEYQDEVDRKEGIENDPD